MDNRLKERPMGKMFSGLWCVLSLFAVASCDGARVPGEVRGMPESATAYAKLVAVNADSIGEALDQYCNSLLDSVAAQSQKKSSAWELVKAESDRAIRAECEHEESDPMEQVYCRLGRITLRDVTMKIAQGVEIGDAPLEVLAEARRLRSRAVALQRQLDRRSREQHDAMLRRVVRRQDSILREVILGSGEDLGGIGSDGSFSAPMLDSTYALAVFLDQPMGPQLAVVPPADEAYMLAYDSATFSLSERCNVALSKAG